MRTGCDLSAANLSSASLPMNLRPLEVHSEVEAGLDWVDGFGKFVAVEWHRGFEAERVASAEAAGHATDSLRGFDDLVPYFETASASANDFETIFAGVACSADRDRVTRRSEHGAQW